ncbi:MAG: type II/IV secretion system protein [Fimbriimonadaceae bacterium]|nr:type II/IV secretion system protein [Fimbriimonadaceae bacterium]
MRRKQIGDILLEQRLVTNEQLERAIATQQRNFAPIGSILVRMGVIDESRLLTALATQIGVQAWDLRRDPPKQELAELIPMDVCESYQVLPIQKRSDLLVLGMVNPLDTSALDFIHQLVKMRVEPVLVDESRMMSQVRQWAQNRRKVNANMDHVVKKAMAEYEIKDRGPERDEHTNLADEESRPVVNLVNQIISDAIRMHASDIHIEPRMDRIDVRYRIDGRLVKLRDLPDELLPMLSTRLKIMAELDIVEQRHPQDGRMTVDLDGQSVDVRVSVVPNVHGARIVLRVLDQAIGLKGMEELGFTLHNFQMFQSLIRRPYGLFLVTGPTGSGKTTSLYAALEEIKDTANNVMTVEDPVEYRLDGINQSQINESIGVSFPKQLRAILRQDPDVILVGEIRDLETAETAVRAAMTGHLVLSTLHCNDAASAVPRLLDLGVDPYLLSSSLIGVTAQRLLRNLCPDCKREDKPTDEEQILMRHYFGAEGVSSVWRANGCNECYGTGYSGRQAVHEVLPVTSEVASLIADRAGVEQIKLAAEDYGFRSLQEDALERVLAGQTTLEEAMRLIAFERLLKPTPLKLAA